MTSDFNKWFEEVVRNTPGKLKVNDIDKWFKKIARNTPSKPKKTNMSDELGVAYELGVADILYQVLTPEELEGYERGKRVEQFVKNCKCKNLEQMKFAYTLLGAMIKEVEENGKVL